MSLIRSKSIDGETTETTKRKGLVRRKPKERPESPYITLRDAAALLHCDESTIRTKRGGFNFALVRRGEGKKPRILLIRAEVDAHIEREIEIARAAARKLGHEPLNLVYGS